MKYEFTSTIRTDENDLKPYIHSYAPIGAFELMRRIMAMVAVTELPEDENRLSDRYVTPEWAGLVEIKIKVLRPDPPVTVEEIQELLKPVREPVSDERAEAWVKGDLV